MLAAVGSLAFFSRRPAIGLHMLHTTLSAKQFLKKGRTFAIATYIIREYIQKQEVLNKPNSNQSNYIGR
jgi:hypothetical protein